MFAIETEVRGQQPLFGRVVSVAAPTEVDQQPSQIQGRHGLGQFEAEEAVGNQLSRERIPTLR
jgi:hypothetical protein